LSSSLCAVSYHVITFHALCSFIKRKNFNGKLTCPSVYVGLGRPRRRREDEVTTEIGWEGVDWIQLAQDGDRPVAGSCEHGDRPQASGATDLVT
jgi:hypothetical protein